MNRTQAIAQIAGTIDQLDDEQLAGLAEFTRWLVGPSVYSSLPESEKQAIEEAIARLDRGEGLPGPQVFSDLRNRIASARAKGKPAR